MSIIKACMDPVIWVLFLLVVGLVYARGRRENGRQRMGWWLVFSGTLLLLLLSLQPVATLLNYSMVRLYKPVAPERLQGLDVVVVLGGGMCGWEDPMRPIELSGQAYARWFNGVSILQAGGTKLLAFCGGRPREDSTSEAEVMKAKALTMGVPEDKILIETESKNTEQNVAWLAEQLPKGKERRIAVVTSALHMHRSLRVFEKHFAQDEIIPVPVFDNYHTAIDYKSFVPHAGALSQSKWALHEWIGLVWYAVRY